MQLSFCVNYCLSNIKPNQINMSKRNIFLLLLMSVLSMGTVCGQDSDSIAGAKSVKIPIWDNGFRIGLTSQAQLVLPATLTEPNPYVKSLPGFGGENGIEFSYHFGYFGVSLGLNFGTFRVFNFEPHFENAPGADLDDLDFWFHNQFHHYSMVHNVFLPLKLEFHYPFNDKFAIMADLGAKFAVGYHLQTVEGNMWMTTYEDIGLGRWNTSLVADVGFYYRLPYGDLLRGSIGANVGFQHVSDGTYKYENASCNVQGEGTFFTRNTNFNLQAAYIHTFHRYKQKHKDEPFPSELSRHEFQLNIGDPTICLNNSSIGQVNYFYGPFHNNNTYNSPMSWTQPVNEYPITRFVPTFSFNYHYRLSKWFWVGGLTTIAGLHNTWHDRFTDEVTGHGREVHVTWMPDFRFSYLNREHVTLYSGFGVGLEMISIRDPHQPYDWYKSLTNFALSYQLTAFGVKAGAKHWFGNLELGYGHKGIVSAGFGYEF